MIWALYGSILVLIGVVFIITSKRRNMQTFETSYESPTKIERNDFPKNQSEILVLVFTSKSCGSCEDVVAKAQVLNSDAVNVEFVEYGTDNGKKLHEKYQIEAVPTICVCDENGVVTFSNIGPITATDLWAGVARSRGDEIQSCSDH